VHECRNTVQVLHHVNMSTSTCVAMTASEFAPTHLASLSLPPKALLLMNTCQAMQSVTRESVSSARPDAATPIRRRVSSSRTTPPLRPYKAMRRCNDSPGPILGAHRVHAEAVLPVCASRPTPQALRGVSGALSSATSPEWFEAAEPSMYIPRGSAISPRTGRPQDIRSAAKKNSNQSNALQGAEGEMEGE
jgi:hypothetical protein